PERLGPATEVKTNKKLDLQDAHQKIREALSQARPGAVRVIAAPVVSPSLERSFKNFETRYKATRFEWDVSGTESIARAHEIFFGDFRVPYFNFEKADV